MRDEITEIVKHSPNPVEELSALMCYREVKGIIFGMNLDIKFIDNYISYFVKWMNNSYDEQVIRKAIEKVKREHEPTK